MCWHNQPPNWAYKNPVFIFAQKLTIFMVKFQEKKQIQGSKEEILVLFCCEKETMANIEYPEYQEGFWSKFVWTF